MARRKAGDNPSTALSVFPWYVERFARSPVVREMNGFERGVYLLLLGEEWTLQGKGLPAEEWRLQQAASVSPEQWEQVRETVLSAFEVSTGSNGMEAGRLFHPTCEAEIAAALRNRETARRNGAKGGRPRKSASASAAAL